MITRRWSVSKVAIWAAILGALYSGFNLFLNDGLYNANLAFGIGELFGNIAGEAAAAAIIAGGFAAIRNIIVR